MSRHHHVHANEVTHVVNDVRRLSVEEAQITYGIEIHEDGSVFDPTYNRKFTTIGEWAEFSVEQDEMDYAEEFGHSKQTHSDYG